MPSPGPWISPTQTGLVGTASTKQAHRSVPPEIEARCFALEGERLTKFMGVISTATAGKRRLSLGHYTLDTRAEAFLNGNKFFQRHAVVVGSTGTGKSWTTARLLEQVSYLESSNAIVFDMHGEYASLAGEGFDHLRVAGPADIEAGRRLKDGVLHLPYWLMSYEALAESTGCAVGTAKSRVFRARRQLEAWLFGEGVQGGELGSNRSVRALAALREHSADIEATSHVS